MKSQISTRCSLGPQSSNPMCLHPRRPQVLPPTPLPPVRLTPPSPRPRRSSVSQHLVVEYPPCSTSDPSRHHPYPSTPGYLRLELSLKHPRVNNWLPLCVLVLVRKNVYPSVSWSFHFPGRTSVCRLVLDLSYSRDRRPRHGHPVDLPPCQFEVFLCPEVRTSLPYRRELPCGRSQDRLRTGPKVLHFQVSRINPIHPLMTPTFG